MEKIVLGRTGLKVSRICFGGWQAAGWSSTSEDEFVRTLQHAIEKGINFIDTAEEYGKGRSEELIGQAIKGKRDKVVLATKFFYKNSAPAAIKQSLESSLKRLGTDYVDIYQQHWPPKIPALEDSIACMEELKAQGKIRAIGVSNWMEPEWQEFSNPARIQTLQPCYSLLWRSIEPKVLPLCREHNIGVLAYSPLCQGILSGRFKTRDQFPRDVRKANRLFKPSTYPMVLEVIAALEDLAKKYDKSPAQVALRWILDTPGVSAAIVGATKKSQVDENLRALNWSLESVDWGTLSAVSEALSSDLKPHDTLWDWHPRERK